MTDMYTDKRTSQGGSVAVFLVVSVLLAAAVIGGSYALQKRGAHVTSNQPVAVQNDKSAQKNTSDDKKAAEDKQKADDEAKKQAEQKAADDKKAAEQKQAAEKQAAADAEKKKQADQQAAAQQQQQASQSSPASSAESLPHTGPSDSLPEFIGAALLLAAILAYLKSYRHRFGSFIG